MRYFAKLKYDGSHYHGWQKQENAPSVQEEIEKALALLLKQDTAIVGSGRTDSGVHASCQFFHFDAELNNLPPDQLAYKLNALLNYDIAIDWIKPVHPEAHARFDATHRGYYYYIHFHKDPFLQNKSWHCKGPVPDIDLMNKAAALLVGKKDFRSFSKVHTDVNNFYCELAKAEFSRVGQQMVFHVQANRFLRGMVRALVGTLLLVGQKKIGIEEFKNILAAKDRAEAGANVPPHGLFLCEVAYPDSIYINE